MCKRLFFFSALMVIGLVVTPVFGLNGDIFFKNVNKTHHSSDAIAFKLTIQNMGQIVMSHTLSPNEIERIDHNQFDQLAAADELSIAIRNVTQNSDYQPCLIAPYNPHWTNLVIFGWHDGVAQGCEMSNGDD